MARKLAPSAELRKWFDHDPARFAEFRARYRDELAGKTERLEVLRRRASDGPLTILYAARDQEHNNAVVLVELLGGGLSDQQPQAARQIPQHELFECRCVLAPTPNTEIAPVRAWLAKTKARDASSSSDSEVRPGGEGELTGDET